MEKKKKSHIEEKKYKEYIESKGGEKKKKRETSVSECIPDAWCSPIFVCCSLHLPFKHISVFFL